MDHIRAGQLHHNSCADRDDNGRICGQQIFIGRIAIIGQFIFLQHHAVKAEVMIDIFIAPIPLVSGHFDGDICFRDFLLLEQNWQGEGPNHNQNAHWDDRPSHFDHRMVGEGAGRVIAAAVELECSIGEQTSHKNRNHCDDDQQEIIEPDKIAHQFRSRKLKANAFGLWLADGFQSLEIFLCLSNASQSDQCRA